MLKSSRQLGNHPCLFLCPYACCLGSSLGALCNLKLHPQLSHREPRLTYPPVVPLGWHPTLLPPTTLKLAASDCLPNRWRSAAPQSTELNHIPRITFCMEPCSRKYLSWNLPGSSSGIPEIALSGKWDGGPLIDLAHPGGVAKAVKLLRLNVWKGPYLKTKQLGQRE